MINKTDFTTKVTMVIAKKYINKIEFSDVANIFPAK